MHNIFLVIIDIPSPDPFPDCIETKYSLLEGEEKIRLTSSPSFDQAQDGPIALDSAIYALR